MLFSSNVLDACLDCRLAELVVDQLYQSQIEKNYHLTVHEISKSANGNIKYVNSSAEINLGYLTIHNQSRFSSLRSTTGLYRFLLW